MNRKLIALFMLVLCLGLYAQWSVDAANPYQINTGTSAQVMPKTAITNSEYTWVAWMDNTAGNYNTYLQLLNPLGYAQWETPLLVSSHPTMTWLTDWDIDADPDGSAVLVFQDIRQVTNNVVAYKISSTGAFIWGNDGIMLSPDLVTDYTNMAPTVLCLSNGNTVVAWQRMATTTQIKIMGISSTGQLLWGGMSVTLSMPITGGNCTWPQFLESEDSNFLVKYFEDTGPFWSPTRKIRVLKFNPDGIEIWSNYANVQGLGGISAWTQMLSITSNNSGGMFIAWHDDRNADNISDSYVQGVNSDGTMMFQQNGVQVTTETTNHQFNPKVAYEPNLQEVYVFWNKLNGDQNSWGLQAQKLSLNGERLWGDTGNAIVAMGGFPTFPISAGFLEQGVVFVYSMSPQAGNDQSANLFAYCINPAGQSVWTAPQLTLASTSSAKLHYNCASIHQRFGVIVWEDGGGPSATCAMRFNANGSLGMYIPAPFNLVAEIIGGNHIRLTWEYPETFIPPIGFKVFRNGVMIEQQIPNMIYDAFGVAPGTWTFYVTAVFEDGFESPPSNAATVTIVSNQDNHNAIVPLSLSIYPNPFQKQANIALEGMKATVPTTVSIYNFKGQIVRQIQFSGKSASNWIWDGRDMLNNKAGSGVYLVKVNNGQTTRTSKILMF